LVSRGFALRDLFFKKYSKKCVIIGTNMTKKIQIVSLFPDMFKGVFNASMLWKAQDRKIVEFGYIDLRDFGIGPRKQVDDTPYGGGDGMLLKPEPLFAAVEAAKGKDPTAQVLLMTPRGERWSQQLAQSFADDERGMIFVCGRYEGYDERITAIIDRQISVGDYVLTGGEIPAMAIVDSVVRLIPGVLGGEQSAEIESFSDGETLEFPQYTRPAEFRGVKVPDVLLQGNHAQIAAWRAEQSKKASFCR
jgi:tRNA (guanine37-N1)-methyltransferase